MRVIDNGAYSLPLSFSVCLHSSILMEKKKGKKILRETMMAFSARRKNHSFFLCLIMKRERGRKVLECDNHLLRVKEFFFFFESLQVLCLFVHTERERETEREKEREK